MNERKLFQEVRGITLIALVISIIVMLILAGVSLNAVVGDNGIITQAQDATYMQSVAILEEYLNSFYIENYDKIKDAENKVQAIKNLEANWFFQTTLGYVVDNDGNALYLINKTGLPEELKNQIKGGDAGEGTYADYSRLEDVYGVTTNLKVYYCGEGKDSILGISKEDLDKDNPLRIISEAGSPFATLITGNSEEVLNAEKCKSVKDITINRKFWNNKPTRFI